MKRLLLCLCLAAACFLLSSCARMPISAIPETTLVPGAQSRLPETVDTSAERGWSDVTLYYRYRDEPFLAPESRTISQSPSQSREMALLTALLSGPGTQTGELTMPFPTGTQILSAYVEKRILFVTLSEEILSPLPDEPVDWQEHDDWRVEVPLRRRLCMQSLAATVTENCDVDAVQVLVGSDPAKGRRLRQNYFMDDSLDDVLALPLRRDGSLLLTPAVTLNRIMQLWISRDWSRLYTYLSAQDRVSGGQRPALTDFIYLMESLSRVNRFEASDASVSQNGHSATFSVTAVWTDKRGRTMTSDGVILHLQRETGLWKISYEQLTGWIDQ